MQRYILTEYAAASEETKKVYDDYLRTTGDADVPVWLKSMGHSASLAHAYWERAKGTLFNGILPLPLKELLVFSVSAKNNSRYCCACHANAVLALDKNLRVEDLQAFVNGEMDITLPPYYKQALDFANKIQSDPNSLEDEDFERLMDSGFGRKEIQEIIGVIDMTMMFNTYTSAFKLDLDPGYRAIL